ncbi:MAG TPA: nuclease-related domain-containing protein, partial [Anaerolineales bacterium]|nr:nuclease-related domain-containing protein [Anaerolineales bacterium]
MSDLSPLLYFGSISLAIFIPGLLIGLALGFTIKSSYRSRLLLNQNRGEADVRKLIISNFKAPNFHLLNNVTIPFQDGTTQIDQILISTKGVFVIEVKHYSGWIFGNEKSNQWTQTIYHVKNTFQNPIHQNFRHVKAIQQILDFLPKDH